MKKSFFVLLTASLFSFSCGSTNDSANDKASSSKAVVSSNSESIPFTEANNYFVKNTVKDGDLANPKITTQQEFDKYFGAAATMSATGKPTSIDFTKQFVIANTAPSTDKATTIKIDSLNKNGNLLTLSYSLIEGEKQSFTIRPLSLLIVNNQYSGDVILQKNK